MCVFYYNKTVTSKSCGSGILLLVMCTKHMFAQVHHILHVCTGSCTQIRTEKMRWKSTQKLLFVHKGVLVACECAQFEKEEAYSSIEYLFSTIPTLFAHTIMRSITSLFTFCLARVALVSVIHIHILFVYGILP
jgi:hypothetical protein